MCTPALQIKGHVEAGDDVSNIAMHVLMADDLLLYLDSDKE